MTRLRHNGAVPRSKQCLGAILVVVVAAAGARLGCAEWRRSALLTDPHELGAHYDPVYGNGQPIDLVDWLLTDPNATFSAGGWEYGVTSRYRRGFPGWTEVVRPGAVSARTVSQTIAVPDARSKDGWRYLLETREVVARPKTPMAWLRYLLGAYETPEAVYGGGLLFCYDEDYVAGLPIPNKEP